MKKTFRGRITFKSHSGEEEEIPEVKDVQIHVEVVEIDGKLWVDTECPNCQMLFAIPIEFYEALLKDAQKFKKTEVKSKQHSQVYI